MSEATISVVDSKALLSLFGTRDQHLRRIRDALSVDISARDHEIHIQGAQDAVAQATEVLEQLKVLAERYGSVSPDEVGRALNTVCQGSAVVEAPAIDVFQTGRVVRPLTAGQARFVEAIRDHDVVLGVGPAGTGKTYLAVAMAVSWLKQNRIRKIVLVRPAVEAGESLGFLPGDVQAKINPYLRPLLDALQEMMDFDLLRRFMEQDVVEVIPLAYMRGRTLNEAFIILDEAQNTTVSQMKMFLTRMGRGSRIVVAGDTTQVDLPTHTTSGLIDALRRLEGIPGITRATLSGADIVRHSLVHAVLRAYEEGPKRRG